MNIFVLDKDPIRSGQMLLNVDKRRANKMCIEFIQASAVIAEDLGLPTIYKKDGKPMRTALARRFPKPIMAWLRESRENYEWVWDSCEKINSDYLKTYTEDANNIYSRLPLQPSTSFVNYAKSKEKGLDFTSVEDVPTAYKLYLEAQGINFK